MEKIRDLEDGIKTFDISGQGCWKEKKAEERVYPSVQASRTLITTQSYELSSLTQQLYFYPHAAVSRAGQK